MCEGQQRGHAGDWRGRQPTAICHCDCAARRAAASTALQSRGKDLASPPFSPQPSTQAETAHPHTPHPPHPPDTAVPSISLTVPAKVAAQLRSAITRATS